MPHFATKIHRKFIATIAGLAVVVTGLGAAPAAADQDDTARALTAILGLALLGAVIHESRRDDKVTRHQTYHPRSRPVYRQRVQPGYHPVRPRPLPQRAANRKLLPQACLRTFNSRAGKVNGFGEKCLSRSYRHVGSLPRGCAVRFRDQHGYGRGYDARCLRQRGYQLARR